MDIREVTYTDENGDEQNAYDYLLKDGNLGVPGGRYGTHTDDCAEIAILLFLVHIHANGEDSIDLLDGCMSQVVNSGDEVCWTILDYQCAFDDITEGGDKKIKLNPFAYFEPDEIAYARELYTAAYCGETPNF